MTFAQPNLVVLKRSPTKSEHTSRLFIGAPDNWYDHQAGLITKSEVRAVTLSKLRLLPDNCLWDLGAGSGSVSMEAALLLNKGIVYAVEKDPDRIKLIESNKKRFDITNLRIIQAKLPEGLTKLPQPDRIFIGGGGKDLQKIIKAAVPLLKSDGVVVINSVLLSNVQASLETLKKLGYKPALVEK